MANKITQLNINGQLYDVSAVNNLIAGDNISITDGVISAVDTIYDDSGIWTWTRAMFDSEAQKFAAITMDNTSIISTVQDKIDGLDSEGGFVRKSTFEQTAAGFSASIQDLTSEGMVLQQQIDATADNLTLQFSSMIYGDSETEGVVGTINEITKRFKFDTDGLTISGSDKASKNTTSTRLDVDGMHILSANGKDIASATSTIFKTSGSLGVVNWTLNTKSGKSSRILNIYTDTKFS